MKKTLFSYCIFLILCCMSCSDNDMNNPPEDNNIAIQSLKFTVAENTGKILAKKLYYTAEKYTQYSTESTETTLKMDVTEHEITGCIPYLFDKKLVPTISCTTGSSILYRTDGGKTLRNGRRNQPSTSMYAAQFVSAKAKRTGITK